MKKHLGTIFFLFFVLQGFSQHVKDSLAIITLLEKESATWRAGDIVGHADCWHLQPYSKIIFSTQDSSSEILPSLIINPPKNWVGNGGYSVNTNYKISINKNFAWVSHYETSFDKNEKKTLSYEIRFLEKIKNQWKLVGQTVFSYP